MQTFYEGFYQGFLFEAFVKPFEAPQVTCETHHISLLVIQQCQMHETFAFYVFDCNLKE